MCKMKHVLTVFRAQTVNILFPRLQDWYIHTCTYNVRRPTGNGLQKILAKCILILRRAKYFKYVDYRTRRV